MSPGKEKRKRKKKIDKGTRKGKKKKGKGNMPRNGKKKFSTGLAIYFSYPTKYISKKIFSFFS